MAKPKGKHFSTVDGGSRPSSGGSAGKGTGAHFGSGKGSWGSQGQQPEGDEVTPDGSQPSGGAGDASASADSGSGDAGASPSASSSIDVAAGDLFSAEAGPIGPDGGVRTPVYTREQLEADRKAREQNLEGGRKHRGRKVAATLIVLATLAIALGVVYHIWLQIPITVTVNGSKVRAPHQGTTVQTLFEQEQPDVTPGNHLDITGGVITEGGGDQYEATVNGNAVSYADAASYTLRGDDDVTYTDGSDTTEDYTVGEATVTQPKLKMEGSQGVIFYVKQWGKATTSETHTGSESGKSVEVVTDQGQDCVVERANVHPANDQKLVALTFDDGPTDYTNTYLDILDQYGIKATFCEIGSQIDENPDASNRVVSEGCQLISHTWDHKQLTALSADEVRSELTQTFQKIKDVTGVDTTALRQPYGSMNADVWLASGGSMSVAAFWTHDSEDWERPGADKIVANCTSYYQSGSIILMHDGGGNRDQDVEALPRIIQAWQDQGYTFVTLSELLDSDPDIPDDIASCDATMPENAAWPTEISADSANNAIP